MAGITRRGPLELELPLPPSANRIWKAWRSRIVLSAAAKLYRRQVDERVQLAGSPSFGTVPVIVSANVIPGLNSRDIDNSVKSMLDALTHAGVWADDSQVRELHVWLAPRAGDGCVRVLIDEAPA